MEEIRVVRSTTVGLPKERAFETFTSMDWWPVATHHLAEPPGVRAVLEPRVGGRWYEEREDGTQIDWGTVLAWEPPNRILMTWQISARWEYEPDPAKASEFEVVFSSLGPDRTRVEVSHRHLERYGDQAERMRAILERPSALQNLVETFGSLFPASGDETGGSPVFRSAFPLLYVADVERSLHFYRDLLGFEEAFRIPSEGRPQHVELTLGGSRIAVTHAGALAAMDLEATAGHPFEPVVWADDADQAVAALAAMGVTVVREPFTYVAGHRRAYVLDPDGNRIAIVSAG